MIGFVFKLNRHLRYVIAGRLAQEWVGNALKLRLKRHHIGFSIGAKVRVVQGILVTVRIQLSINVLRRCDRGRRRSR